MVSIALRIALFPYMNNDLSVAVIPWYQYLLDHGGLTGIQGLVYGSSYFHPYSYSPVYLYSLLAASPLTRFFSLSVVIKIVSILFDYVSAFFTLRLIDLKYPSGWQKWIGFFLVLFAPTVFINSAYWGQCDGIYGAFLMGGLYYLLADKKPVSLGLFFSALLIKIQALVLAPVYAVLMIKRQMDWRWIFVCPLIYIFWMAPAFLAGYPLNGTILTLTGETEAFSQLTMNAPNIFAFVPNAPYEIFSLIGLALSVIVCCVLLWRAAWYQDSMSNEQIILLAVLVSIAMPYFLPRMHERYFYAAALISLLLPFYLPKLRLVPLALQVTSLLSYTFFLRGYEVAPLSLPAAINGIVLIYLGFSFIASVDRKPAI